MDKSQNMFKAEIDEEEKFDRNTSVSPSDDDLLDLAECINEIGPGPTSNSRRFQGLPTLIMREEHGHRVPCDPRQVTRVLRCHSPPLPLPPIRASWAETHHPPPQGILPI